MVEMVENFLSSHMAVAGDTCLPSLPSRPIAPAMHAHTTYRDH